MLRGNKLVVADKIIEYRPNRLRQGIPRNLMLLGAFLSFIIDSRQIVLCRRLSQPIPFEMIKCGNGLQFAEVRQLPDDLDRVLPVGICRPVFCWNIRPSCFLGFRIDSGLRP